MKNAKAKYIEKMEKQEKMQDQINQYYREKSVGNLKQTDFPRDYYYKEPLHNFN